MTALYRSCTFLVLSVLLVSGARCQSGAGANAEPTADYTQLPTIPPSPTPWLDAFLRVTQEPVVAFWWGREGSSLYYETEDHRLWRYDPVTDRSVDITSEAPVYGQPLPSVLSRIPEEVPEQNVYFAPSGTKALFAVVTYYHEESTPAPNVDGEQPPSGSTSELWYVTEEEPEPRWLGTLNGTAYSATWSQDESRVLLILVGHALFPCVGNTGWLIMLQEGQMWELFPATTAETSTFDDCSFQIAPDGQSVFFYRCIYSRDEGEYGCEYYSRILGEGDAYRDEPVQMPLEGQPAWLLPNNRGLLITDGILIYLYGLDDETWLQLNSTSPPYTWGSVPMDPPGETTRVIRFSPDARYIAWNGYRGLQVFSLCPGGGELLDCE